MKLLLPALCVSVLFTGNICYGEPPKIDIRLNSLHPAESTGVLYKTGGESFSFPVGYGRNGILCSGSRFKDGYSLTGTFRVNAVLSSNRFDMDPDLIRASGKTAEWLKENLFKNMSSIDFNGDGINGEYGAGFISLQPLEGPSQPFRFGEYKSVFRWYSYAIHGSEDEKNDIGSRSTGGCINIKRDALDLILEEIKRSDIVRISADETFMQSCEGETSPVPKG